MRSTKLSAILFVEIPGFSQFLERNGERAIAALTGYRDTLDPILAEHGGETVDATGDELLVLFDSAVAAAQCGHHLMAALRARNAGLPPPDRLEPCVGIHLGEIWRDGNHVFGNGINVAARVKAQARPWVLLVSEDVYRQIENKFDLAALELPVRDLKNIERPLRLFEVSLGGEAIAPRYEDGQPPRQEPPKAAPSPAQGSAAELPENASESREPLEAFPPLPPLEPLPPLHSLAPKIRNKPGSISISLDLGDDEDDEDDPESGEDSEEGISVAEGGKELLRDPHARAARKFGSALTGSLVGLAGAAALGYGYFAMGRPWWMAALAIMAFFVFAGNASSAGKASAKLREIERKERRDRG